MEDLNKSMFITCPICGAEYLPCEIFIPNAFFGRPKHIERDETHKIIHIIGPDMNTTEQFICNYCNNPFRITSKISFIAKSEMKFNFDDGYSTVLKKPSLFLNED